LLDIEDSLVEPMIESYDNQAKTIKEEIFTISWYMRGGVTSDQLMYQYSAEDRNIIVSIINKNIENTKKSGMPMV
jgi:hypothetical protein